MGFKENLIVNYEGRTLEYNNVQLYVLKQFDYENHLYLYCADKNTIGKESFDAYFLYKIKDDIFNHVDNQEKFLKLMDIVSGEILKEFFEQKIKKLENQ